MNWTKNTALFILVFLAGITASLLLKNKAIGDFGNYYYGSKLFAVGENPLNLYQHTHWFNKQIKSFGEKNFFENYAPVPPFSLLFYYPFIFLQSVWAKFIFNLLSVFVFSFSLTRFIKHQKNENYLRTIVFLFLLSFPIYNNLLQGQSYLIISAVFLEIFLAWQSGKSLLAGFLIALVFHLKLFPIFILLFFIFRREYKIVVSALLSIFFITAITILIIGFPAVENYLVNVLPRILKNEIVEPFYYGHQSIKILLKNLFVQDDFSNPAPLFHLPYLALIVESILNAIILYTAFQVSKMEPSRKFYGTFIFCGILLSGYITSYALLMFLPFVLVLHEYKRSRFIFLCLLFAFNLPLPCFENSLFVIKFFRIFLMLITFVYVVINLRVKFNYAVLGLIFIFFTITGYAQISEKISYLKGQNKNGIYYNLKLNDNKIFLNRCMGEKDFVDTISLDFSIQKAELINKPNKKFKTAYCVNDSLLIYLSDVRQGIGMNKVMIEVVKK